LQAKNCAEACRCWKPKNQKKINLPDFDFFTPENQVFRAFRPLYLFFVSKSAEEYAAALI